jgi:hypothetical protein
VPRSTCIFCGEGRRLSRTHIWPAWLNRLLAPGVDHLQEFERPKHRGGIATQRLKQGSLFTLKPYLACVECNTGWMKKFEDEMCLFAKPLFTATETVTLDLTQIRTMAGWIALITILAEHFDKSKADPTIPQRDIRHLKQKREPPHDWSIFAASSSSKKWFARYHHAPTHVGLFRSLQEYTEAVKTDLKSNTQTSSFGIGRLFIQAFTCPRSSFVSDYRRWAVQGKLAQIWPPPRFIGIGRPTKFPTDLVLSDETADELAVAYPKRMATLTEPFSI